MGAYDLYNGGFFEAKAFEDEEEDQVDRTTVIFWVSRLEAALQDDQGRGFPQLFEDLSNDFSVTDETVSEIAKEFYGRSRRKLSRQQALDLIWERYERLEAFRGPSSADRSAS